MSQLDSKGRCCGRKPLVYKRPVPRLFCVRCNREFDPTTGGQVENWAWKWEWDKLVKRETRDEPCS